MIERQGAEHFTHDHTGDARQPHRLAGQIDEQPQRQLSLDGLARSSMLLEHKADGQECRRRQSEEVNHQTRVADGTVPSLPVHQVLTRRPRENMAADSRPAPRALGCGDGPVGCRRHSAMVDRMRVCSMGNHRRVSVSTGSYPG